MGEMPKYAKDAIVLVVVTAIILAGIAIIGVFSQTFRTPTAARTAEFNLTAVNTSITVDGVTVFPFPQTLTNCGNVSANVSISGNQLPTNFYTVAGLVDGTRLILNDAGASWVNEGVRCNITYLADSTNQANADVWVSGLATFATFLGVLVIIILVIPAIALLNNRDK